MAEPVLNSSGSQVNVLDRLELQSNFSYERFCIGNSVRDPLGKQVFLYDGGQFSFQLCRISTFPEQYIGGIIRRPPIRLFSRPELDTFQRHQEIKLQMGRRRKIFNNTTDLKRF